MMYKKSILLCASLAVTSICFANEDSCFRKAVTSIFFAKQDSYRRKEKEIFLLEGKIIKKNFALLQEKINKFKLLYEEKCLLGKDKKEQECETCNYIKNYIEVLEEKRIDFIERCHLTNNGEPKRALNHFGTGFNEYLKNVAQKIDEEQKVKEA